MKVTITNNDGDEYGMYMSYSLKTPKSKLSFLDGRPEDNNLCRNFSDVFSIENIIQEAYEAGKNGEPLDFEYIEEE